MAERCSFCGEKIERGTGKCLVKGDGNFLWFCTRKCEKNLLVLRRNPLTTRWTRTCRKFRGKISKAELEREAKVSAAEAEKKEKKAATPKLKEEAKPADEKK